MRRPENKEPEAAIARLCIKARGMWNVVSSAAGSGEQRKSGQVAAAKLSHAPSQKRLGTTGLNSLHETYLDCTALHINLLILQVYFVTFCLL